MARTIPETPVRPSTFPVASRDDLSDPAEQARTAIAVGMARDRIGSAKLVDQRERCFMELGEGRFGGCRVDGRERDTEAPQRTTIRQGRLAHLHPSDRGLA